MSTTIPMTDRDRPASRGSMPPGQYIDPYIRPGQVTITEGGAKEPEFDDDAAASLAVFNYQIARNFLETNSWLLDWQETDILYQSPERDRNRRGRANDRPPRISTFIIWRNTNVMRRQMKRALFAEQNPFVLRARQKREGETGEPQAAPSPAPPGSAPAQGAGPGPVNETERYIDQWTHLLSVLNKRSNFVYNCKLVIDSLVLQGTGIGRPGWETRKCIKWRRKRRVPEHVAQFPTGLRKLTSQESDAFDLVPEEVTESWPFFEYRKLGTTFFDPRWNTPNRPDLSSKYAIDIDFVNFRDLQQMRKLPAYDKIPDDETLKAYFLNNPLGDAPSPGQMADALSSSGSIATHAAGANRHMSIDPLMRPLMIVEMTTEDRIVTILNINNGADWLTIRNGPHRNPRTIPHMTANWSNIDSSGYGIGIGRVNTPDQRINSGVITEALKMLAYPMNAPILIPMGRNAPTQNLVKGLAQFWGVETGPDNDVRKSAMYLETPPIPADAWKFIAMTQQDSEHLSGADSTFAQGQLGGPGSSAARTATGANRISAMSDANISDPVDAVAEGIIIPWIEYLMHMVKTEMPIQEIRNILGVKFSDEIIREIDFEQFLDVDYEIEVLAGQKLMAKQGIMQMIPFFLQIVQQPQLLQYQHEIGKTVDFQAIMDVLMQMSELQGQPDFFRELTPKELQMMAQANPGAQRVQQAVAQEQVRGQNKLKEIGAQTEADITKKAAETALEHASGAVALNRAAGLEERKTDENILENGVGGQIQ